MPDRQLPLGQDMAAPPHGPGCKPTLMRSRRFPGEPRYICVPGCPRKRYLDRWLAGLPVEGDRRA